MLSQQMLVCWKKYYRSPDDQILCANANGVKLEKKFLPEEISKKANVEYSIKAKEFKQNNLSTRKGHLKRYADDDQR